MKKRLKFSINNTVVIAFSIIIVVLLNIMIPLLEARVPSLKIDVTKNAVTKISDETKDVLDLVDKGDIDIDLICLKGTGDVDGHVKDVLEQYDAYCNSITYKVVNYHTNPAVLEEYGLNAQTSLDDSVIVAAKDKSRAELIQSRDMMQIDPVTNITAYQLERCLTGAVGRIARGKDVKVLFSTGHGEIIEIIQSYVNADGEDTEVPGGLLLLSLMQNEGINYNKHSSVSEIPLDTDLYVIMSPQYDYTKEEIDVLDDYLKEGGNVAVALSADYVLENLEAYLAMWGIKVNNDIVTEKDDMKRFDDEGIFFYANVGESEYVSGIGKNILTSYVKSMEWTKSGDIEGEVLLHTSDNAVSMPMGRDGINAQAIKEGKFNFGYVLERPVNGSYENTAKLIVTSSESVWGMTRYMTTNNDFYVYTSLKDERFGNRDFVVNMISCALGEQFDSVYLTKFKQTPTLTMTASEASWARFVLGMAFPFVIVLWGIVVWLKRRNK